MQQSVTMPSGVVGKLSVFDRFATATSNFTSRAVFFVACVIIVGSGRRRLWCCRTSTPGS